MKALTVRQPWASLIVHGPKWIETRSQSTNIRGRIGIVAGMWKPPARDRETWDSINWLWNHAFTRYDEDGDLESENPLMPWGALIGTVELYDCVPIVASPPRPFAPAVYTSAGTNDLWWRPSAEAVWPENITDQFPYGDFTAGRWAWLLRGAEPLAKPIPMRGFQGWREVEQ